MSISEILIKMIDFSDGNLHDISHFLKVYAYAKTIGEREGLDREEQTILEAAAIVHDIACPLCREKYGSAEGKYQELEGAPMTVEFLKDSGLSEAAVTRIAYLVGHHHTLSGVSGMDHQILLEADYLVNAEECNYSREKIADAMQTLFKTKAGTAILKSIYG